MIDLIIRLIALIIIFIIGCWLTDIYIFGGGKEYDE